MAAGDTDKVAAKAEKATKAATQKAEKVAKRGAAKLEKAVKAQDRKRAERAIDDDDEPDEDELHEEAQDSAVRFLQKAFRSKRARRLVKELIISNYVKEYDADKECFVYKNKRTGARQSNKPIALGADDLPDPVATFAPQGYETHPSGVRQFALVLHIVNFEDRKLPPLAPCVRRDHEALRRSLAHPHLAKFREEDCIFALNATRDAMVEHFETLASLVKRTLAGDAAAASAAAEAGETVPARAAEAVLFVYISTHVLSATKDTYFCCADSSAQSAATLQKTALSLKQFTRAVAKIQCPQKFLVVDCCHAARPRDTFFKTVVPYAPADLYAALAKGCDARVFGSCKLGPQLFASSGGDKFATRAEADKRTRGKSRAVTDAASAQTPAVGAPSAAAAQSSVQTAGSDSAQTASDGGVAGESDAETADAESDDDAGASARTPDDAPDEPPDAAAAPRGPDAAAVPPGIAAASDVGAGVGTRARRRWGGSAADGGAVASLAKKPTAKPSRSYAAFKRLYRQLPRVLPRLDVSESKTEEGKYVVLDEIDEMRAAPGHAKRYLKSSVLGVFARIRSANARRAERKRLQESKRLANYEQAYYAPPDAAADALSVFGGAVVKALRGAAATSESDRVSAKSFFETITRQVQSQTCLLEQRRLHRTEAVAKALALEVFGDEGEEDELTDKEKLKLFAKRRKLLAKRLAAQLDGDAEPVSQTPQTYAGRAARESFWNVCSAPALPPAPHAPCAIRVRDRSCLLEWSDAPFSGAAPVQYQLQSKGTAKYDSQAWADIGTSSVVTQTLFQAPHLVPGMAVRFRVRSRNQAGWGPWSAASSPITPTAQPLVSVSADMERAAKQGLPYVLRSMEKNAPNSEAQRLGCWQLAAAAQRRRGFKREKVAKDTARIVLVAMERFALDSAMQAQGCLVLGWCFYEQVKVARQAQEPAAVAIAAARANFPQDVAVNSNATWALSNLYPSKEFDGASRPSTALAKSGTG